MGEIARIADVLEGRKVLGMDVTTFDHLVGLIRRGLPCAALHYLAGGTGIGRDILGIGETRHRRRLKPAESNRVARTARVFARVEAALGSPEKARAWLHRPNRALGMIEPCSLLDTDVGVRRIPDTLGRVESGTF